MKRKNHFGDLRKKQPSSIIVEEDASSDIPVLKPKLNAREDESENMNDLVKVNFKADENEDQEVADIMWVQCDNCEKWRATPRDLSELPDVWICSMNDWDENYNECDKLEEAQEEDTDKSDEEIESEVDVEAENKAKAIQDKKIDAQKARDATRERKDQEELTAYIESLTPDEIIEARKAAVKKNGKKQIPLHLYAIEKKSEKQAIKLLRRDLYFGADVNAQDKLDRTPLHYAHIHERYDYHVALLKAGADPNACDIGDRCPEEHHYFPSENPRKCMWDKFI